MQESCLGQTMSSLVGESWKADDPLQDARLAALGARLRDSVVVEGEEDIGIVEVEDVSTVAAQVASQAGCCKVLILKLARTDDVAPEGASGAALAAVEALRRLPVPIVACVGGNGSDARMAALSEACDARIGFGRPVPASNKKPVHLLTPGIATNSSRRPW